MSYLVDTNVISELRKGRRFLDSPRAISPEIQLIRGPYPGIGSMTQGIRPVLGAILRRIGDVQPGSGASRSGIGAIETGA